MEPITVPNRIYAATVAGAALTGSLLAISPAAHAEDQRPCVSWAEYDAVPVNADRVLLEKLWDVRGRGVKVAFDALPEDSLTVNHDKHFQGRSATHYLYRFCGYSRADAVVEVSYTPENRLWYWIDVHFTAGHP